jgi:hypothetical protein
MASHQNRSMVIRSDEECGEGDVTRSRLREGDARERVSVGPRIQTMPWSCYGQLAATILTESTVIFGPVALDDVALLGALAEPGCSSIVPVTSTL